MSKYEGLLKQGEKEKNDNLAPARAQEQKGVLGLRIAQLDLQIQSKKNAVETAKGSYPLDVDTLVSALDELALDERLLTQLKATSVELFGS